MEVRCNLSLNTRCSCGEGGRERGGEGERMWITEADARLIRMKEGWCMGVGPGVSEREREKLKNQVIPVCSAVSIRPAY